MTTTTRRPKASRVLARYTQAGTFTTFEILAALQLDGWLSLAMWTIAAWNLGVIVTLTIGLAVMAEEHMTEERA